jgi:hypothetical protein
VSIGRGTIALVALGLAAGVAAEAAAQPPTAQPLAKKRVKIVLFKARVISDGFVTPGQAETVAVTHMPPRTTFKMAIEAPPTTLQCGQLYFCDVAPVTPTPDSAPFRSDKRGETLVSFVMPSTYNIATDPFDPATRHPVTFADQQRVHIDVEGVKRLRHKKKIGFGFGRAIVQTG